MGLEYSDMLPELRPVDTPWVARLLAKADDSEGSGYASPRGSPSVDWSDEVAAAIAYLASPAAGATTGTLLAVDGGVSGLRLPRV